METYTPSPPRSPLESRALSTQQFLRRKHAIPCNETPVTSKRPLGPQPLGSKPKTLEKLLIGSSKKLSEISFTEFWRRYTISGRLSIFSPNPAILPLRCVIRKASHIILVSLSYSDPRNRTYGNEELEGTKFDFQLMLKHFNFRHDDTSGRFVLLNDFHTEFVDADGVRKMIPPSNTSRDAIQATIQSTMKTAGADSRILFYFAGHGEQVVDSEDLRQNSSKKFTQAIVAGDGELIFGWELRSWFGSEPHRSVSVTAIFDACYTGGILGLPYTYEIGRGIQVRRRSKNKVPITMLEISAARPGQLAFSAHIAGGFYGQMSWCLVQYLKATSDESVEGLVHHLYNRCDPSEEQLPQICCSQQMKRRQVLL